MYSRLIRELVPIGLILLVTVIGYLKLKELPDQIAIHFDINGKPDNWMSKEQAVLLLPALYLCTYLLLSIWTYFMPAMFIWKVLMIAFLCNVHLVTIYYNTGGIQSVYWPMTPSVILLLFYVIYLIVTIRS
jgi:uncharacterized membrane protein